MFPYIQTRVLFRPSRQDDVINAVSVLLLSEVETVFVYQEFRQHEEFGDELFHIGRRLVAKVKEKGEKQIVRNG